MRAPYRLSPRRRRLRWMLRATVDVIPALGAVGLALIHAVGPTVASALDRIGGLDRA